MKINRFIFLAVVIALGASVFLVGCPQPEGADNVDVLHWWTSGGEAAALNVLKDDLEGKGISWTDDPVAGGGGDQARAVAVSRVAGGNPPAALQALGFSILDWAEQGVVADLNDLAVEEGWDDVVPDALKMFAKYNGQWIAAPVNIHSTNWVWGNKAILDEIGVGIPSNWDEFVAAMQAAKDAGYIALAHGGQAWQDATIFDGAVLSAGGPEFYKRALVDLDPAALNSPTMQEAFDRMAVLRSFVDDNFSGRDWNLASALVIEGEAAFQIMGDWAKGEFLNAGQVPDQDFVCFRFPGTQGSVTFNADQFVMFEVGEDLRDAQNELASSILSPSFQIAFNTVKGSVPARTDVSDAEFDDCGKKGMRDLAEANAGGTLFGSMAHGHANIPAVQGAMYDVVTAHFNQEMNSTDAVVALTEAANAR